MNEPDAPGDEIVDPLFDATSMALEPVRYPEGGDSELARRVRLLSNPEALSSAFQPVFLASTGELEGCEALARLPPTAGFDGPYEAFRAARRTHLLLPLQSAAIVRHLRDARPFLGGLRLFMNVSAPLFVDRRFGVSWLRDQVLANGMNPGQVVLELPEIVRVRDLTVFAGFLEPFRREGFRIALDDFGAGYTNLRMIVDLSPDFVKVDRVFIEGISSHVRKRILVESVVTLCHRVGCSVVAEGVEVPEDLQTCLTAGVDLLQGYLFARPTAAPEAFSAAPLALPAALSGIEGDDLRMLADPVPPVDAEELLSAACERFLREPDAKVLPVVRDGRPVRLLRRESAAAAVRVAAAEGASPRTAGAPLPGFEESFDRIAEMSGPEEAAAAVARRPASRRFDPLVAVGPDLIYRGLISVDALLGELARLKVEYSLQSHPVTQLPGRLLFERTVARRLSRHVPVAIGRLKLSGFGAYNERYGFQRGDDLLDALGTILRETLREEREAFPAHISGADFAFLCEPARAEAVALALLRKFSEAAPRLHDPADIAGEGFFVRDRAGAMRKVPLVAAAVGIATWEGPEPPSVRALLLSAQDALSAARRPGIRLRVRVVAAPAAYDQSPSLPGLEIPEETTEELEEVAEAAEAADEPEEAQEADAAETAGMDEGPEEEPVTMVPRRKAPPA